MRTTAHTHVSGVLWHSTTIFIYKKNDTTQYRSFGTCSLDSFFVLIPWDVWEEIRGRIGRSAKNHISQNEHWCYHQHDYGKQPHAWMYPIRPQELLQCICAFLHFHPPTVAAAYSARQITFVKEKTPQFSARSSVSYGIPGSGDGVHGDVGKCCSTTYI